MNRRVMVGVFVFGLGSLVAGAGMGAYLRSSRAAVAEERAVACDGDRSDPVSDKCWPVGANCKKPGGHCCGYCCGGVCKKHANCKN